MKALSFAGRLQLIKSILGSIHVYWSSHFLLPKRIINRVEQLIRDFLWKGHHQGRGVAKVAWKEVVKPHEEGGLGIKSLNEWNKAAIAKLLWKILDPNSISIWTKWVDANLLKGKPFWEIPVPSDCTWAWRKILSLRSLFWPNIKSLVGNGSKVFLWYDYWLPMGPIHRLIGDAQLTEIGAQRNARVSQILRHGQWRWPWASSAELRAIKQTLRNLPVPIGDMTDDIFWLPESSGRFTIRSAWESIRARGLQVEWHQLVWHMGRIPKASFCLWLAVRARLYTQDRMTIRDPDARCFLCNSHGEDHDHLFFRCEWSKWIWSGLQAKCGFQSLDINWRYLVSRFSQEWKMKNFKTICWKLCLASTVFNIWKERNSRLHNGTANNANIVRDKIEDMVRMKLASFKGVKDTQENRELALVWNLPTKIFSSAISD